MRLSRRWSLQEAAACASPGLVVVTQRTRMAAHAYVIIGLTQSSPAELDDARMMRRRRIKVDKSDRIDELANDLDELKTTAEELEDDPPAKVERKTIEALQQALEHASDAADELIGQKD